MVQRIILFVISFIITTLITSYKGDEWEQPVRNELYSILHDSIPQYSIEITDENGIPYVDYKTLNGVTAGKQYNPTIVCNYAIGYYHHFLKNTDSLSLKKFYNCSEWLCAHLTQKNDHALFAFNWQQPWYDSVGVPFTSGMTSGLAIKVFTIAYGLSRNETYLRNAKQLLNGFYVPINKGGFTYMNDDGWWYEEIADSFMHTPKILDGHIFALTGLHEFISVTNNDSARFIFNKGIAALKNSLAFYDIGDGWSYYDKYHKPADRKYHKILTAQMKELYEITGDDFFLCYYKKWNEPLSRIYLRRIIEDGNRSGIILFVVVWFIVLLLWKLAFDIFRSRKA